MAKIIELVALTKKYPQGEGWRVVLDRSVAAFDEGEFVAVRGRSGSGKTTLLNLIAGLDVPTSGRILIDGSDLAEMTERDRTLFRRDNIGIIFQFFNLIPTLTVLENVLLPAELSGGSRGGLHETARSLLARVGLDGREDDFPDQLSGGEQQRVAIARSLVHEPKLLLADEPTGNLDRETGDRVLRLLQDLTQEMGKTLVIATHSREVSSEADRVLTIQEGKVVLDPELAGAS
ncbi:MAG: ABC transporter ATP-binding protein [Anaerolineales bacterium]